MPYSITLQFADEVGTSLRTAVQAAANRWAAIITAPAIAIEVSGGYITDGVIIFVEEREIDGADGILAQTQLMELRHGSFLPALATMVVDATDWSNPIQAMLVKTAIMHEVGHALGFGSIQIWQELDLIKNIDTKTPLFIGRSCLQAYNSLNGKLAVGVPLENKGTDGTRGRHWHKAAFGSELMTGIIARDPAFLSIITISSFQDMGYAVDEAKADPYQLPSTARKILSSIRRAFDIPAKKCYCSIAPSPAVVLPKDAERTVN